MRDQKLSNGFPTLERRALAKVRERYPRLQRKGFSHAVRIACKGECLPKPLGIIHDSWFVDGDHIHGEERGEPALFTCIEIEDHHRGRHEHRSRAIRNGAVVRTETTGDDLQEIRVEAYDKLDQWRMKLGETEKLKKRSVFERAAADLFLEAQYERDLGTVQAIAMRSMFSVATIRGSAMMTFNTSWSVPRPKPSGRSGRQTDPRRRNRRRIAYASSATRCPVTNSTTIRRTKPIPTRRRQ